MIARIASGMIVRFVLIFLFLVQSVFSQVPNFSFENWTNSNPDSWQTANIPLVPASVLADSDAIDGYLSVKGIVVSSNHNRPFPPYLGISGGGAAGFAIANRFNSVTGWCKLSLLPGDKFKAYAKVYNNLQEPIGDGTLSIGDNTIGWTPFTINISYYDSSSVVNCALFFTVTDSTELMSGQIGSYFLLDNLSMVNTVGINENLLSDKISVYPNPAQSELHIHVSEMKKDYRYSIIDVTGKKVVRKSSFTNDEAILLSDINPGIYFLNIFSDDKHFIKKIIVQ